MRYILALLFALIATSAFAQGKTINQLNPGAALTGTELMPMFQGGNPAVTTTPNAIKTFTNAGIISGTPGIITVTQPPYNAKCDGITDDTAAIQSAINAAGGAVVLQTHTAIVFFPAQCAITSTLTARQLQAGYGTTFLFQCSGGGAGLIWRGADNTGPMLQFGDPTGVNLDGPFEVQDCFFNGVDNTHKPSVVLRLANTNLSRIINVAMGGPGNFPLIYNGLICDVVQCLLTEIDHLEGSCAEDCVKFSGSSVGSIIRHSQFGWCGRYCYEGINDALVTIFENYFEGTVAGSLGSIFTSGSGDRIVGNRFEDGSALGGPNFVSVECSGCQFTTFTNNFFLGAQPGGPNYTYQLDGNAGTNTWINEAFVSGGNIAVIHMNNSVSLNTWIAGQHCAQASLADGAAFPRWLAIISGCPDSAGPFDVYTTGYAVNSSGTTQANAFLAGGGFLSTAGSACNVTYFHGGPTAGDLFANADCAGTTFTINFGITTVNGWSCNMNDRTTAGNFARQSATTTSTATFITSVSTNDIINFVCVGY